MQILKYIAMVVTLIVVCGAGLMYWLYRSINSATEENNEDPKITLSPGGNYQALVFEAIRGDNPMSSDYSTWVAIFPAGQKLKKHEDEEAGRVMGCSHGREEHPAVSVQWLDNSQLRLRVSDTCNTEMYYRRDNMYGIKVEYAVDP